MLVLNAANRDFSEIIPGTPRLYAIANAAEGRLYCAYCDMMQFFVDYCGALWFICGYNVHKTFCCPLHLHLYFLFFNLYTCYSSFSYTVACPEVNRLETSRAVIFEAVRCSFASAYDALVQDPSDRVSGAMCVLYY